jgi:hypothetical protein
MENEIQLSLFNSVTALHESMNVGTFNGIRDPTIALLKPSAGV